MEPRTSHQSPSSKEEIASQTRSNQGTRNLSESLWDHLDKVVIFKGTYDIARDIANEVWSFATASAGEPTSDVPTTKSHQRTRRSQPHWKSFTPREELQVKASDNVFVMFRDAVDIFGTHGVPCIAPSQERNPNSRIVVRCHQDLRFSTHLDTEYLILRKDDRKRIIRAVQEEVAMIQKGGHMKWHENKLNYYAVFLFASPGEDDCSDTLFFVSADAKEDSIFDGFKKHLAEDHYPQ
jgi:hypothetical protein